MQSAPCLEEAIADARSDGSTLLKGLLRAHSHRNAPVVADPVAVGEADT
ncbi:hypothetical protein [Streptomyces sp. NPDC048659]